MSSLIDTSCANCHQTEEHVGHALKRCGGCKSVSYCGQQCQKADRPKHRSSCRFEDVNTILNHIHTTMGFRMAEADNAYEADASDDIPVASTGHATKRYKTDDTPLRSRSGGGPARTSTNTGMIYYLQTSIHHLHEIYIHGPYRTIEELVRKTTDEFGDKFEHGINTLHDAASRDQLNSWEHVISPMNGEPDTTTTIRVLSENNPIMATKLPGPAWTVVAANLFGETWDAYARFLGLVDPQKGQLPAAPGDESKPVKDKCVIGTFGDKASARKAALRVAKAMAHRAFKGKVVPMPQGDSLTFGVRVMDLNGIFEMNYVTVRYNAGA